VYCKIEISGPDATRWLDAIVANKLPPTGRLALGPLLTPRGRILGDLTVAHLADDRYMLMGSPMAEAIYLRWLTSLRGTNRVSVVSKTASLCGFSLTGPVSRAVLERVADADVSNAAFPFSGVRTFNIGRAPVVVLRISFTGELGYEVYMPPEYQRHVYDVLARAGVQHGLRNFGVRALNSLRIEKGYGGWGREYTQDATPAEAGWERLIQIHKGEFVGREAVMSQMQSPARRLRLLAIDSRDPDPAGGEPVSIAGQPVGRLSSAAYGHTCEGALGLTYLAADLDHNTQGLEVEMLGCRSAARILETIPYDPSGSRMRS
jgi:dimethylglycine dehydrogenase